MAVRQFEAKRARHAPGFYKALHGVLLICTAQAGLTQPSHLHRPPPLSTSLGSPNQVLDPGGHQSGAQIEIRFFTVTESEILLRFIVLGVAAVNTRHMIGARKILVWERDWILPWRRSEMVDLC